eukprot:CAMPEP_0172844610 /NCGR_PEP_ID=MMETSP1075-20121228/32354_1 /TAXON_ID=2916 /ORGANISM="Ceratium fusus, Strain PA161109" /LENGTH=78 /DNA_ID=CAMNT_0013689089 /DNA_START=42 /DNA_END=278 /DNA_ORIENTATION=-
MATSIADANQVPHLAFRVSEVDCEKVNWESRPGGAFHVQVDCARRTSSPSCIGLQDVLRLSTMALMFGLLHTRCGLLC